MVRIRMKSINPNNLGKKYLVDECQNIRIEKTLQCLKFGLKKALIEATVEIDGFVIVLTNKKLHHGGDRLWFVCPLCRLPAGVVYRHPIQSNLVGCRNCLDLEYSSRRYKGMVENEIK